MTIKPKTLGYLIQGRILKREYFKKALRRRTNLHKWEIKMEGHYEEGIVHRPITKSLQKKSSVTDLQELGLITSNLFKRWIVRVLSIINTPKKKLLHFFDVVWMRGIFLAKKNFLQTEGFIETQESISWLTHLAMATLTIRFLIGQFSKKLCKQLIS